MDKMKIQMYQNLSGCQIDKTMNWLITCTMSNFYTKDLDFF